jgi:M6 family metalloprotease-like protein
MVLSLTRIRVFLPIFFALSLLGSGAATLNEFGYQLLKVNGKSALGQRPLLIILADYQGGQSWAHGATYYDDLIFNQSRTQNVVGYFLEQSNGRFTWQRAGLVRVSLTDLSLRPDNPKGIAAILSAALSSGFNFAAYDVNHDGIVTHDELHMIVFDNFEQTGGATRWGNPSGQDLPADIRVSGVSVGLRSRVSALDHQANFSTVCHELSHPLGTLDLYGAPGLCVGYQLTLMSCTIDKVPDGTNICHLDPWHKLALGWIEPRILSTREFGTAALQAQQMLRPDGSILLYDPARNPLGPLEYFLLEFRSPRSANGSGYDANVASRGLAIWHVQLLGNGFPAVTTGISQSVFPGETGWKWCPKCQGLYLASIFNTSVCPAGGNHSTVGDVSVYVLHKDNPSAPGQSDWRWCTKCKGLFYGPHQAESACPAGGSHDATGSGDYTLPLNVDIPPGQPGWRWCSKCRGLSFGPNEAQSVCPLGGHHDGSQSGNFTLGQDLADNAVLAEGSPTQLHGSSNLWGSNQITPRFYWLDGSLSPFRLHVHPIPESADEIIVTWWNDDPVWVDFRNNSFQNGTFEAPYAAVATGMFYAPPGGTVRIKAGNYAESLTITKRVRIDSYNGPAIIGR